jgi:hypothetical protein
VKEYGWFDCTPEEVMNEATLIDDDGQMYRPDRVIIKDGKVTVVDYKFGEHYDIYDSKLRHYARIWKKMGYEDVSALLWYVHTGEVRTVV